jgi:hypothetical protein
MSNVRLLLKLANIFLPHFAISCQGAYVNLSILKSYLQVIVYGFVRDFADQSKI